MSEDARRTAFGPNDWLLDEMYRAFLADPASVGESWQEFFADYRPPAGRTVAPLAPAAAVPREDAIPLVPPGAEPLRGGAARLAENMDASLAIPTATTFRTVAVKLLEENRALLNHHLKDSQSGKVSFTHVLAWALVRALKGAPGMWAAYREIDGQPHRITPEHLNLGLAVDVQRRDGTRTLLVPNLKAVEQMDFAAFFSAYNDLLRRVHANQISPDDFAGTTVSLTNPGMLGTSQSVPRLMPGQSFILAAGSIAYPPEYQLADPEVVSRVGVSKVMTLTCTYDHRVIQGAESGTFLGALAGLLAGEEDFYEEIFAALDAPHLPYRVARDVNPALAAGADALVAKQAPVLHLINMYRVRGHLLAHLNPLGSDMPHHSELELARYGLSIWDLDREFFTGGLAGKQRATLREILRILQDAYCDTVGIEYMHIQDPDQKVWIQERVEGVSKDDWLTLEEKRRLLAKLNAAEAFERFLHTNYLGHKRFSLEGGESVIPMLDRLLSRAADAGVDEVVMGMAHRGRLNVLSNIVGMSYKAIFKAFEELDPESREGTGDVKYHLGARGMFTSAGDARLRVTLASNPSHLEAVGPVVEGMARAIQDVQGDAQQRRVLPVLVHGDAAFAGQGVVAETFNMSALAGYRTGGTLHLVINNGIGFTTAPLDARSSVYATDVAKMVQAPIFHVNGDDPEACLRVIDLAFEFRQNFGKDIVVDLICYRVHGHNEADEPAYTQPLMYERIAAKRSVRKLYTERLINRGDLTLEEAKTALADYKVRLEEAFAQTRDLAGGTAPAAPPAVTSSTTAGTMPAVHRSTLDRVLLGLTSVPAGFTIHPKLARAFENRARMLADDAVDWGTAELLAFGTLVLAGTPVRLSGQDSRRGTFSQRHAVLVDFKTGASHTPLQHLDSSQAPFLIYDSLLSEYAVCGFEYGYSVSRPEALVLWEAQFGDFANGAQIIVDQFLAAAAEKWGQRSRLVLLLPHGHEGQGPEHSSARPERFLQLCAGDNLRVAMPSTAAQHFHLLRRQAYAEPAAPLVVLTPKSLLRAREARSAAAAFEGAFQTVLDDPAQPAIACRVLLCSGKVAYDLLAGRGELGADTAVVRVEQLNPFPAAELAAVLDKYGRPADVRWVQEEPRNMGAWSFVAPHLQAVLGDCRARYVGRPPSGSPATGSARRHQQEQRALVAAAFAEEVAEVTPS